MRRKLFSAFVFSFLFATASAQYNPYWQWGAADSSNTYPNNHPRQIVAAANGKALWGHLLRNKLTLGTTTFGDYSLSLLDTAGHAIIASGLSGKVSLLDAHADAAGNWYVLGVYYDTLRLTNGTLLTRGTNGNEPDHFIARLNGASLNTDWINLIGVTNDASAACFTIANGTIYLPVDSGNETQVRSLNTISGNGVTLFTQAGKSITSSIAVEPGGSILLTGSCAFGGMNFNGTVQQQVPGNNFPAYLVRYSPTGTHRWHHWLPEITCVSRKVNAAPGGVIYYTGALFSGFTFGTQTLHGPAWTYDFVAARLDTLGNVAWVRQIDTVGGGDASLESPYNAVVAPDTSLVIFAQTRGFVDWRDNVSTGANQYYQSAAVAFGRDGHTRWARQIKGDLTTNQQIATDGSDAVWVTGNSFSSLNYLLLDTTHVYVRPQRYNAYIAKLKLTPRPPTGVMKVSAGSLDVTVYPNPAAGQSEVTLHFTAARDAATIMLSDVSGKLLRTLSISPRTADARLSMEGLAPGIYFLDVRTATARKVLKVMVQQ